MNTELKVFLKTGPKDRRLTLTKFGAGNKGLCIQLTQGLSGQNTPGYIQLTIDDAFNLTQELADFWSKNKPEGWIAKLPEVK